MLRVRGGVAWWCVMAGVRHRWWCLDDACLGEIGCDTEADIRKHMRDEHNGDGAYFFGRRPEHDDDDDDDYRYGPGDDREDQGG